VIWYLNLTFLFYCLIDHSEIIHFDSMKYHSTMMKRPRMVVSLRRATTTTTTRVDGDVNEETVTLGNPGTMPIGTIASIIDPNQSLSSLLSMSLPSYGTAFRKAASPPSSVVIPSRTTASTSISICAIHHLNDDLLAPILSLLTWDHYMPSITPLSVCRRWLSLTTRIDRHIIIIPLQSEVVYAGYAGTPKHPNLVRAWFNRPRYKTVDPFITETHGGGGGTFPCVAIIAAILERAPRITHLTLPRLTLKYARLLLNVQRLRRIDIGHCETGTSSLFIGIVRTNSMLTHVTATGLSLANIMMLTSILKARNDGNSVTYNNNPLEKCWQCHQLSFIVTCTSSNCNQGNDIGRCASCMLLSDRMVDCPRHGEPIHNPTMECGAVYGTCSVCKWNDQHAINNIKQGGCGDNKDNQDVICDDCLIPCSSCGNANLCRRPPPSSISVPIFNDGNDATDGEEEKNTKRIVRGRQHYACYEATCLEPICWPCAMDPMNSCHTCRTPSRCLSCRDVHYNSCQRMTASNININILDC
jgi:hypothetical protein